MLKDFVLSDKQIKSFTCIDFLLFYLYDRWVASFMNLMEDLFVKEATQWVLEQLRDFLSQLMWVFSCYLHVRHIPANPAYSVYISQLVRHARICTSKVDFINRLCGLSLRPRQQGFETNLLQKSFNKFFSRHGLIVEKYGAALREMRLAIQAWIAPSYPYITYLLLSVVFQLYLVRVRVQFYFERVHYLFIYLIYVYI